MSKAKRGALSRVSTVSSSTRGWQRSWSRAPRGSSATGDGLRVEIFQAMPPDAFRQAWRKLSVAAENPFSTPEWLEAWMETNPPISPLVVGCRRAGGELVGVVALVDRGRRGLEAVAATHVDWFGPACAAEDEPAVAAATLSALRRDGHLGARGKVFGRSWTMHRCPLGGGWLSGVEAAGARSLAVIATERDEDLSLVRFSAPRSLPGKDRRELRRSLRRLTDAHEVAFRCARRPEEARRDFATFRALHASRWPDLRDPRAARFHEGFALRAAEQGWLRLWTLEIDGTAAAMLYGWRLGGRSFAYMQAFDRTWSRHGVGILLLAHAIEQAEQEDCTVFDMLRGKEYHKARFENDRQTVRTHVVVRRPSLSGPAIHAHQAARLMYDRIPNTGPGGAIKRLVRRQ